LRSDTKIFKMLNKLLSEKSPDQDIFDKLNPTVLNSHLNKLMPKLSAKVFRTYNASIVLDGELAKMRKTLSLEQKQLFYTEANTRVAILCNHQRAAGDHGDQIAKMEANIAIEEKAIQFLEKALARGATEKVNVCQVKQFVKAKVDAASIKKGAVPTAEIPGSWEQRTMSMEQITKMLDQKQKSLSKHQAQMQMKEASSTVSLSTSKVNYMDPRITIAWCKRNEIEINDNCFFSKSLVVKFAWAMSAPSTYKF
jgi:DNA topoisomerase-1